jgi:hypothetical protein
VHVTTDMSTRSAVVNIAIDVVALPIAQCKTVVAGHLARVVDAMRSGVFVIRALIVAHPAISCCGDVCFASIEYIVIAVVVAFETYQDANPVSAIVAHRECGSWTRRAACSAVVFGRDEIDLAPIGTETVAIAKRPDASVHDTGAQRALRCGVVERAGVSATSTVIVIGCDVCLTAVAEIAVAVVVASFADCSTHTRSATRSATSIRNVLCGAYSIACSAVGSICLQVGLATIPWISVTISPPPR